MSNSQYQRRVVVEAYRKEEFYNPRVRATIPGCWMVVFNDGSEYAVCRDYEASTAAQAMAMASA
jgi:alkylhydroperoxidase family enzyme